jgi:hypothetical protein
MPTTTSLLAFVAQGLRVAASFNSYSHLIRFQTADIIGQDRLCYHLLQVSDYILRFKYSSTIDLRNPCQMRGDHLRRSDFLVANGARQRCR